jgi:hypothetical protein
MSASTIRIATTALLLAAPLACSSDSGSGDTEASSSSETDPTQGTSETSGSTSTTGPTACDQCVPTTPMGWTGPVAISRTSPDGAPSCAGAYTQDAGSFGETFEPGSAMCECRCAAATGIMCEGNASVCYADGADSCTLGCDPADVTLMPGVCTMTTATGTQHGRTIMPDPVDPGSCEASENHMIPEPTWGTAVTACGRADAPETGCADTEVCAPEPEAPFDRVCIFQVGMHDCPDPYISRALIWGGYEDTRSCSGCTCGAADSECGGSLENSGDANCGNVSSTIPANGCAMTFGEPYTRWNLTPTGSCEPSTAQLSGTANPVDQTTLCCLAPFG